MHAGTRIVRLRRQRRTSHDDNTAGDDCWSFDVLAKFEEHQSMNYGSDVQPPPALATDIHHDSAGDVERKQKDMTTVVSTSFYDQLLCLWRFDTGDLARQQSVYELAGLTGERETES